MHVMCVIRCVNYRMRVIYVLICAHLGVRLLGVVLGDKVMYIVAEMLYACCIGLLGCDRHVTFVVICLEYFFI